MKIFFGLAVLLGLAHCKEIVLTGQGTFRPPSEQLFRYVLKGNKQKVKQLLLGDEDLGLAPVDINVRNYMGRSTLFIAAEKVDIPMVQYLLKLDAEYDEIGPIDLDSTDYWGNTALNMIARAPAKSIPHGETAKGWPLMRQFEKAYIIMKALIQAGANVDKANQHGVTPLFTAASTGFADGAQLLVDNGADKDYVVPENGQVQRYSGHTPLDVAYKQKSYLAAVKKSTTYYDRTIETLCALNAAQVRAPNAC
jgi:hypothetical protein